MMGEVIEREYFYWARDRVLEDGTRVKWEPISREFETSDEARAVEGEIKAMHPDAVLIKACKFD